MKERIDINEETLERLKKDDEFYNYFIKNIGKILARTKPFCFYVLQDYFDDEKIKKLVMRRNNMLKVIKKSTNREDVLNFLLKQKKAKLYINDFFMEKEPGVDTEFSDIIRKLKRTLVKDSKELLKNSKPKKQVSDIQAIGNGCYSEAYQIGNYVLKVGRASIIQDLCRYEER